MIFTWSFISGSISIVRASVRQGEPRLSEFTVRSVSLPSQTASSRTFSRIPSRDRSDTRLPPRRRRTRQISLERCRGGFRGVLAVASFARSTGSASDSSRRVPIFGEYLIREILRRFTNAPANNENRVLSMR